MIQMMASAVFVAIGGLFVVWCNWIRLFSPTTRTKLSRSKAVKIAFPLIGTLLVVHFIKSAKSQMVLVGTIAMLCGLELFFSRDELMSPLKKRLARASDRARRK